MNGIVREERIGGVRLLLGDCREIVRTLDDVDIVLTDPPYGDTATHAGHLSSVMLRDGTPAGQALGFDGITGDDLLAMAGDWCALARRWVVFTCEWRHAHRLDEAGLLIRLGIWRKPDGAPQFTGDRPGTGWEAVAICHRPGRKRWNGGGRHAFWSVPKGRGDGHPTQKPLALMAALVSDFTEPGEVILDPFAGSGTTCVAAMRAGRGAIGIERDPKHFETACRRVEAEWRQPRMEFAARMPASQQLGMFNEAAE